MRFLFRSLGGLFLLATTLGLLAFAGLTVFDAVQDRMAQEDRRPQQRERISAVNIVKVELADIRPVLSSFGEVRSRRTLDLRASSSGTLIELAEGFEDGGRVETGQLLARIDPADAEAALAVAETDMQEALAALAEAERALIIAGDDLASAREQAVLREAALARAIDLRDRGVGTAAAVETAELASSSARQAVLSRRQALANAESQVDRAKTTLSRIEISLAEAQRALAKTEIFADFSGTLTGVTAVEGGIIANNERLAQIIDTDALEVAFRVSTPQYARLLGPDGKLAETGVTITLDVLGVDLETTGRIVRESASVAEGQTGRQLFAAIDSAGGFRPGDFVLVNVTEPMLEGVAVLPATALGQDGTILVMDEDNRLSSRSVRVLRRQGDDLIVSGEGLEGLSVVSERTPLLGSGIKVRPISPQGAGPVEAGSSADENAMVQLTEDRRARLVAFVEGNARMPAEVKEQMLKQLKAEKVPAEMVSRLESRMGG